MTTTRTPTTNHGARDATQRGLATVRPTRRRPGGRPSSRAGQRGVTSIEMLLAAIPLLIMVTVVVAGSRHPDAAGQVNDAAYAAARAASLQSDPTRAAAAGQQAAKASLAERGKACTRLSVSLAGSDFTPGGKVVAVVECVADLSDVVSVAGRHLGLEQTKTFQARAVVPIEKYRSG